MESTKKILIAPDSFKDCLSSADVARFIGEGIRQSAADAEITFFPVADGGEGTASCIAFHRGGRWRELTVNDPLHRPVRSEYLLLEDEKCAVIELARASGLELLTPAERNALMTSTFGTGELIRDALDRGVKKIILTIGGSATVDGGTGIAAALGFRFTGKDGRAVKPCGGNLTEIANIDTGNPFPPFGEKDASGLTGLSTGVHPGLRDAEIIIACDVQNILNGPEGAARVYGPQKGADKKAVGTLEKGLSHLSALVLRDTGFDSDKHPGTGAAGGAALFLMAYGRGELRGGFDIVDEMTGFSEAVTATGLVITGEGKIDTQTAYGKAVSSVAGITRKAKKPLILVGGLLDGERKVLKDQYGAAGIFSLMDLAADKDDSIRNVPEYLKRIGYNIAKQFID
ncbi:MAG: glycerate kinase [Bacteroidales bacterium]